VRREVGLQESSLFLADEQLQASHPPRLVALERVEEIQRVLDPDVVGIAGESRLEARAPRVDGTQTELVQPERRVAAPRARVETHGLASEVHGLAVQAVADAELG